MPSHRHPRRLISGIPPELWLAAQAKASAKGTNVSVEIVRFLERWVKREQPTIDATGALEVVDNLNQEGVNLLIGWLASRDPELVAQAAQAVHDEFPRARQVVR